MSQEKDCITVELEAAAQIETNKQIDDDTEIKSESEISPTEKTAKEGVISSRVMLSLIAVYFSVFMDMMGVSIVQPILPFYGEKFGV